MIIGNPPKSQPAASMPAAGDWDVSDGGAAENGVKRLFKFQRTRLTQDAPRESSLLGQPVGPAAQYAGRGSQAHWALAADSPVFGRAGAPTGSPALSDVAFSVMSGADDAPAGSTPYFSPRVHAGAGADGRNPASILLGPGPAEEPVVSQAARRESAASIFGIAPQAEAKPKLAPAAGAAAKPKAGEKVSTNTLSPPEQLEAARRKAAVEFLDRLPEGILEEALFSGSRVVAKSDVREKAIESLINNGGKNGDKNVSARRILDKWEVMLKEYSCSADGMITINADGSVDLFPMKAADVSTFKSWLEANDHKTAALGLEGDLEYLKLCKLPVEWDVVTIERRKVSQPAGVAGSNAREAPGPKACCALEILSITGAPPPADIAKAMADGWALAPPSESAAEYSPAHVYAIIAEALVLGG